MQTGIRYRVRSVRGSKLRRLQRDRPLRKQFPQQTKQIPLSKRPTYPVFEHELESSFRETAKRVAKQSDLQKLAS